MRCGGIGPDQPQKGPRRLQSGPKRPDFPGRNFWGCVFFGIEMSFLWYRGGRFLLFSVCAPLCCKNLCRASPFLYGWWGSCGQQIQANGQGPMKQNASPAQSEALRRRWRPEQEQHPGQENRDNQHMLNQPRGSFPEFWYRVLFCSQAWGPPQFQEKRSRSEKAILGALREFRGILGAALGIQNSILGMASYDLSNTKTTILGATPRAIPGIDGNPHERCKHRGFEGRLF